MTRKALALACVGCAGTILTLLVGASEVLAQLEERLESLDRALVPIYDGDMVTLEQCIRAALAGSAVVGQFEEDVENADVDVMAAYGEWLPSLTADANWSRSRRTDFDDQVTTSELRPIFFLDANGDPMTQPLEVGGETAYTQLVVPTGELADNTIYTEFASATATVSWDVFTGTGRFHAVGRAKADRSAAEATLGYQESVLVQNVRQAYFDYVRAKLRVDVAEETEALAQRELERSETYFELGISTRSDVLQQKVRHSQTKLDTVRERNGERNAFAALAHAMNIPSASPFEVDTGAPEAVGWQIPEIDTLLDTGRTRRGDLVAAQYNLTAREKSIAEARSGFWPNVSIFGQWNRSRSETPYRFGAAVNEAYTFGARASWNIFDRFQTKSNTRRAVAQARRAEYDERQAQLDFELEVVQIHNNLLESRERHGVAVDTVEQAQEDLRLAQERFRVGAGTSLDVINAQVNLAQARRDAVDAQADFAKYRAELDRAIGAR